MCRFSTLLLILIAGFVRPAMAVEAVVNHAIFHTAKGTAYAELYWQINTTSLHYRKDSLGRLTARIHTQLRITDDAGIVYKNVYYLRTRPFDPGKEDAQPLLEKARADIPAGRISFELYLSEDDHPESAFYYRDTLTHILTTGPAYSSIQLLDTFFSTRDSGAFDQAGYRQLPRALNFYDEGQHSLYAYLELYHTQDLPAPSYPLTQLLYISKRKGERDIAEHSIKDTIAGAAPLHRFRRSFSLASLPSGNYYLNVSLRSAAGATLASEATFFQTINKHPVAERDAVRDTASANTVEQAPGIYLDVRQTFVARFEMPQLRAILEMLLPAAEPAEESAIKGFLEQPDELYMRYFIYNHFWNLNKADPAKAWKQFSDVVREVNRLYKSGSTMGYETDRGIIHLRYGPPVEVVRVPNEAGALPYEIWRYNPGRKIGGSGLFLFYSPGYMSSDFRLLHSTVPGERREPDWRGVLYSTGHSSGNLNARAEEYFGNK